MNNKTIWSLIILIINNIISEPTINFFIKEYPKLESNYTEKSAIPGYMGYKSLKNYIPTYNEGIACLYAGAINFSDSNGLVRLMRSDIKNNYYLIVTDDLKPIFSVPWVIDKWECKKENSAWYTITEVTDELTKTKLWKVEKSKYEETVPKFSIIIFAPKDKIYVPEGFSIAETGQQILLPTIYHKLKNYEASDSLKVLYIKQFFSPIKKLFNKTNLLIEQIKS